MINLSIYLEIILSLHYFGSRKSTPKTPGYQYADPFNCAKTWSCGKPDLKSLLSHVNVGMHDVACENDRCKKATIPIQCVKLILLFFAITITRQHSVLSFSRCGSQANQIGYIIHIITPWLWCIDLSNIGWTATSLTECCDKICWCQWRNLSWTRSNVGPP